jgi:CO dehydrogenase/acetyl-CoA synthase gamma subunit (corrinoid Fe-S protein)
MVLNFFAEKGEGIMKNPIREQREALGFKSRREFCVTYDVPMTSQASAELGHISTVPKSVLEGLRKAGIKDDVLEALPGNYREWLKEIVKQAMQINKSLQAS